MSWWFPQLVFGWQAMVGTAQPPIHWHATYRDRTGTHTVEAWRAPGHIRRVTDGTLELDASRETSGPYTLVIVDRTRGVTFRTDEHARHMQGHFDDWETWTHVIAPSRALVVPFDAPHVAACTWYLDGDRTICWSREYALPLAVRGTGGDEYTVTSVEPWTRPIPPLVPTGPEIGADED